MEGDETLYNASPFYKKNVFLVSDECHLVFQWKPSTNYSLRL